jgi:hypothetical protein
VTGSTTVPRSMLVIAASVNAPETRLKADAQASSYSMTFV